MKELLTEAAFTRKASVNTRPWAGMFALDGDPVRDWLKNRRKSPSSCACLAALPDVNQGCAAGVSNCAAVANASFMRVPGFWAVSCSL